MIALLVAAIMSFGTTLLLTPAAVRVFRSRHIGQPIQEEVQVHQHKAGVPTMGGLVIVLAVVAGWLAGHFDARDPEGAWQVEWRSFQRPGLLVLLAFVGMGLIGFLDDLLKVRRARNLGLGKTWKLVGQAAIAGLFAWGALSWDVTTRLSFTRPFGVDMGWFYVLWVLLILIATSNAVNFSDGLDGLASGSSALVFAAFTIMSFWQWRHPEFYGISGALELAILATALTTATLGFLWWNTAPARIFMGDTGSQALGGAMAALALLTNTHLLLVILGGIFVLEAASVVIQIVSFHVFHRRVFRMAPLHHHFELRGWAEPTVIVRFWILAALGVALALGIFYSDFITSGGVG
ncbi:MAG TPA: phospho-N-acetylmuramoyl-pentapeptide-transferase [Acidimicrobiia bacterium]|nr:phospho-N-acetylmuramoyl-pentapeptide-transferase [Acidimicrobiia bacterium]